MKIMTYKTFKNWFLGAGLGFLIFIFGLIKTKLCSISGAGGFDCIGWVVPILLGMILFVVSLVYSFVNVIILKRNIKIWELIIMFILSGIIIAIIV